MVYFSFLILQFFPLQYFTVSHTLVAETKGMGVYGGTTSTTMGQAPLSQLTWGPLTPLSPWLRALGLGSRSGIT
jgi:hypothetical protein